MVEAAKSLFLIVSALFPIVDPLGGSPIFLALTRDYASDARKELSRRIAFNSFYLLVGSYLIGTHILAFFGISLPVVQVGGGLIVISAGWAMLKQRTDEEHTVTRRNVRRQDPYGRAFYPLTMPLTVGPGSISVAITQGANPHPEFRASLAAAAAHAVGVLIVSLSVYLCYRYAERILRRLGKTGTGVVVRLSAFILLCIGVQICWNGVHSLVQAGFHLT